MQYVKETVNKASPERVFSLHLLPDAFDRLLPPWEEVKVIQIADISVIGSRAIIETKILGPISVRWVAEHTAYDPPRSFEDVQISGPFKGWRHRHIVKVHPEGAILRDEIEFEPKLSILGELAAPYAVVPKLERMFAYRHEVTRKWCEDETD